MVYQNTIKTVVESFINSLPSHIVHGRMQYDQDQIVRFVDAYKSLWLKWQDEILIAISHDISYYLNYYGIRPQGGIDQFKAIYFTGRVISRFLDRDGLSDLRKINDFVTIALLDYNFFLQVGRRRPVMTVALRKIAEQNAITDKLGDHGMYLIYKSMCNAALGN